MRYGKIVAKVDIAYSTEETQHFSFAWKIKSYFLLERKCITVYLEFLLTLLHQVSYLLGNIIYRK